MLGKFLFLPVGVCLLPALLQAQDLVVKADNIQIPCLVVSVDHNRLILEKKGIFSQLMQELPMQEVKAYYLHPNSMALYSDSLQAEDQPSAAGPDERYAMLPKIRLYGGSGFSYRTAPVAAGLPAVLTDYFKRSKYGIQWNAGFDWYFSEKYGIGAGFSHFHALVTAFNMIMYFNGSPYDTANLQDYYRMSYADLHLSRRMLMARQHICLVVSAGAGYTGYSDQAVVASNAVLIKGSSLGLSAGLSLDYHIFKGLTLGMDAGFIYGSMRNIVANGIKYRLIDYTGQKYENLSRFNMGLELRYYY